MKWTRTKPTKEGYYWFRGYGKINIIVIAYHSENVIDAWRVCDRSPNEYGTALNLFQEKDCEWSDIPVPLPNEN